MVIWLIKHAGWLFRRMDKNARKRKVKEKLVHTNALNQVIECDCKEDK